MIRSSLSNWLGLFVTGLINLILTPILIHRLGDFHYGIWILVFSVVSYYGLLDLGMYTTALRFVARARGEGDRQRLDQVLANSLAITSVLAVVAMLVTGLLVWLVPHFFGLSGVSRHLFRSVLLLLGMSVAITSLSQMLGNYLCGLDRFELFNLARIVCSILRAFMMLLALKWGQGLTGLAWATLIASLISLPLHWYLIRRADPLLTIQKSHASWSRIRELMGFGFFSFLTTVGNYGRFYLDSLVIARVLTVALITPFSIAGQIVEYFRVIVQGVMSPMITSFSSMVGKKCNLEGLQEGLLKTTRFTSLLSLFVGSLLLLNGQMFIRLWVGDRFLQSYGPLAILTIAYTIMLAQVPSNAVLYALNRHRVMAAWTLGEGLANVALSVYLARNHGLVGVALGTAIPMVFVTALVQPCYVLRQLRLSAWTYLSRAVARATAVAAVFFVLSQLGGSVGSTSGLLVLTCRVVWQSILFLLLAFFLGLTGEDRRLCLDYCGRFTTLRRQEVNQTAGKGSGRLGFDGGKQL